MVKNPYHIGIMVRNPTQLTLILRMYNLLIGANNAVPTVNS